MRKALTEAEKQYIYKGKIAGESLVKIAKKLNCSVETAKKWWRYKRDGQAPGKRGRPAQGVLSSYDEKIRHKAVELKRKYPGRGPKRLRLDLQQALNVAESELPSIAGLGELFRQRCPEAVKVYGRQTYSSKAPLRATYPHQLWQMDGKEYVPFGSNELATVLNIRDPYSGAIIMSRAFQTTTELHCRKLTLLEVQNTLRDAFAHWGMPLFRQTDHENVYVGSPERYFPSLFSLWLLGLGIEHHPSRKKRPTDQGSVERGHRTQQNWVWQDETFVTLTALQHGLNLNQQFYNETFPSLAGHCQGQPPLLAFPQANHSNRNFEPALEWQLFDLNRVDAFLAQQFWTRLVDVNGRARLAGFRYYLGRKFSQQTVSVSFLPHSRTFAFAQGDGTFIRSLPARGFDKADIIGRVPTDECWPALLQPFQLPLPFQGV